MKKKDNLGERPLDELDILKRIQSSPACRQRFGPLPVLLLVLLGGAAGFVLRRMMLHARAADPLVGGWPYTCLWILTALVLISLAVLARGMGSRSTYSENFKPFWPATVGAWLAAAAFFVQSLLELTGPGAPLQRVVSVLGLFSASALLVQGYLRQKGRISAPLGMLVCLFLGVRLVMNFRQWSIDPLVSDFCFQLLADVCVLLACYHTVGFGFSSGRRRTSIFFSMAAAFLCCISMADGGFFYPACFLWILTGCCSLNFPPRPRRAPGGNPNPA